MTQKTLLFSLQHNDFEWEYMTCGSNGGQNANRNRTCVRVKHVASGAVAEGREYKSQLQNKRSALERLIQTKEFKNWHRAEVARRAGQKTPEQIVEEKLQKLEDFKLEIKDKDGKWVEISLDDLLHLG